MNKNNFFVKLRDDKGARAIAITVAAMLLYRAVAAVLEPMSDSPLCTCISDYSEVFSLLFIIQLSVGAMFLLLVAQLVMVGHMTVMLR